MKNHLFLCCPNIGRHLHPLPSGALATSDKSPCCLPAPSSTISCRVTQVLPRSACGPVYWWFSATKDEFLVGDTSWRTVVHFVLESPDTFDSPQWYKMKSSLWRCRSSGPRSQEDFAKACDDAQLAFVENLPAPWHCCSRSWALRMDKAHIGPPNLEHLSKLGAS